MALKNIPGPFFLLQAALFEETEQNDRIERTLVECTRTLPQFVGGWLKLSEYYVKTNGFRTRQRYLDEGLNLFLITLKFKATWLVAAGRKTDLTGPLIWQEPHMTACPKKPGLWIPLDGPITIKIYSQAEWMLGQAEALDPGNGMILYHQAWYFTARENFFKPKQT